MNIYCMRSIKLFTLFCIVGLTGWSNNPSVKEAISETDYLFCIDGGGSKTSLEVVNAATMKTLEIEQNGLTSSVLLSGSTNISFVGLQKAKNNLMDLLTGIKIGPEKKDLSQIVARSAIVAGIGGLITNVSDEPTLREVFGLFGFSASRIALFSDVILGKQVIKKEGAFLISGTGSICFVKSSTGEKRIGGFGYALGDEGGGFYIGKLALQKAFQEEFENKPFIISEQIRNILEVSPTSDVMKLFYDGKLKAADVAKIAPLVFEAAYEQKDKRCIKIIDMAATELAKLVRRAEKENKDSSYHPVYLQGGTFKNTHASRFIDQIQSKIRHPVEFINISDKNIAVLVINNQ